ncbi:MAG: hypothetical protein M9962_07100 [Oligoflexia bacterium]|nr:hypothetical protein [Oligoflexia bacterium]
MKLMKRLVVGLVLLSACAGGVYASSSKDFWIFGDEHIFPVTCYDFSGSWKSDADRRYNIEQRKCNWMKIEFSFGSHDGQTTTIVPDDKERRLIGSDWNGVVRHRWNSLTDARNIETYRKMDFKDRVVSEVIMLESVNGDLILESTYRTIEYKDSTIKPRYEYNQQMFRKVVDDNHCLVNSPEAC